MIPFHEPVTLITVARAVVLWAGVAALARAADVNVVGVWKGSMETQMGTVETIITIDAPSPLAGFSDLQPRASTLRVTLPLFQPCFCAYSLVALRTTGCSRVRQRCRPARRRISKRSL